jgi:hypothetical protein
MLKYALSTVVLAGLASFSQAGSSAPAASGKAPVGKEPVAPPPAAAPATFHPNAHGAHRPTADLSAADGFGMSLTVPYESTLFYRGRNQGDDAFLPNLDMDVRLTENITWVVNAKLIAFADEPDERTHLYTGFFAKVGQITLGPSFKWYHWFGNPARENAYEPGFQILADAGPLRIGAGYYYETESSGHFFELGVSAPIKITDNFSLVPAAEIGYADNWLRPVSGFNHLGLRLSAPIKLCPFATLTPFIGGNIALDATDEFQKDEFVGGASIAVKF